MQTKLAACTFTLNRKKEDPRTKLEPATSKYQYRRAKKSQGLFFSLVAYYTGYQTILCDLLLDDIGSDFRVYVQHYCVEIEVKAGPRLKIWSLMPNLGSLTYGKILRLISEL